MGEAVMIEYGSQFVPAWRLRRFLCFGRYLIPTTEGQYILRWNPLWKERA